MAKDPNDTRTEEQPGMETDIAFPPIGEEDDSTSPKETSEAERLAAIEERLQAQQNAFNQERERWQKTVDQLIQRSAQPTAPAPQPEPEPPKGPSFDDLPDPVDRPEEFKRELARRFNASLNEQIDSRFQRQSSQLSEQQQRSQAFDDMWNTFQDRYSDLAKRQTLLRGAILAEQEQMRRQRVDPTDAMLADPEGFIEKVATRMKSELGDPAGEDHNEGGPFAPGSRQANRTAGLAGGSSVNGKGKTQAPKAPGFLDQFKKMQMDDGLI